MNYSEYKKEIESLASMIVEEVLENSFDSDERADSDGVWNHINDWALHETIDGHQWVIYYAFNADVIKHSDNTDYAVDNFGSEYLGDVMKEHGYDHLNMTIAFWCMYADTQEEIHNIIDDMVEEHNSALEESL